MATQTMTKTNITFGVIEQGETKKGRIKAVISVETKPSLLLRKVRKLDNGTFQLTFDHAK